jgi:hypothetical protein
VLPNCDDSATKDLLIEHGWAEQVVPREQLYDLVFDPNEASDLAQDPAHLTVLDAFRKRLETWMRETDDSLLHGPVEPPPGAQVNEPTQRSAGDTVRVAPPRPQLAVSEPPRRSDR